MGTSSYASLFGTNGAGTHNRIGSLFGQNATQSGSTGQPKPAQPPAYQQTFAQMQQAGQARPAPPPPQAGTYQTYQGSQQAQAARAPMLQSIQAQLANPTRFDTNTFNQIRQAQQGNLNAEFGAQRSQLEEEMARRGLSASSIGAGRYGDLAGQQARASATMDAELLQAAAQTQAQDRLASLQAAGQFADLAGSQDLAAFEANRVGQAQQFQEGLAAAQFGQNQSEFDRQQALQAANLEQTGGLSGLDLQLRQQLGMGNLGLDAARLDQQGQQFGQTLGLDRERMGMQDRQFQQGFGLDQQRLTNQSDQFGQDMAFRAQQLQQEAALQGRSMSLQEAQQQAQNEQFQQNYGLDRDRLAQQGSQFSLDQSLRERLGMGGLAMDQARLTQDASQFGQRLTQEQKQFQLQLAAALSGLSPAQRDALLKSGAFTGANAGGQQETTPLSERDALLERLRRMFPGLPQSSTTATGGTGPVNVPVGDPQTF